MRRICEKLGTTWLNAHERFTITANKREVFMHIDRLYSVREALPLIGKGLTGFYAELKAGRIAAIKQGRRTLVAESEIVRYRATLPTIGHAPDKPETRGLDAA
jgi:hypothetical protein